MSEILIEQINQTLHLRLNRPEKKNAITQAMYATLANNLNSAAGDFAVRSVVISGEGKAFTAGNDIMDFMNEEITMSSPVFHFLKAIHDFPKPLIAAVQGNAVGIGTTMLMHCDLVYAAPDTIFSMPFVTLGLVPEAGSSLLFPRLVGHAKASEIFLTGRGFEADEGLEMGLINSVDNLKRSCSRRRRARSAWKRSAPSSRATSPGRRSCCKRTAEPCCKQVRT